MGSEQQILRVSNNRGACCHVAGDMAFDKHNDLWFVTGDDSAAGSGDAGNWGQSIDQKYDDTQTVRVNNATGGTFTLTLGGPDDRAAGLQRDRRADPGGARGALERRRRQRPGDGHRHRRHRHQTVSFTGIYEEKNVAGD